MEIIRPRKEGYSIDRDGGSAGGIGEDVLGHWRSRESSDGGVKILAWRGGCARRKE